MIQVGEVKSVVENAAENTIEAAAAAAAVKKERLTVVGFSSCGFFQRASSMAEAISQELKEQFRKPVIRGLPGRNEYQEQLKELKKVSDTPKDTLTRTEDGRRSQSQELTLCLQEQG